MIVPVSLILKMCGGEYICILPNDRLLPSSKRVSKYVNLLGL